MSRRWMMASIVLFAGCTPAATTRSRSRNNAARSIPTSIGCHCC